MKILSIETSCDETAVTLLEIDGPLDKPDIKVLGNTLLSQVALHEQYGGVYPTLAKREHQKNLPVLLSQTLKEAGADEANPDIDIIAVTAGPGLEPALWAGITFAAKLGKRWDKPVVPVNHMEGHIWSVLYTEPKISNDEFLISKKLELPALALLVSGGHTELVLVKDFGHYQILGRTLDDAVGEAFDKAARMLGLSYPGGPKLSKLASISRGKKGSLDFKLPSPMLHSGDLNFSFSGLKTAVLYKLRDAKRDDEEFKEDMARAFEDAAVAALAGKTRTALENLGDEIKTLIVAGGVSANTRLISELGKMLQSFPALAFRTPARMLTTDNAVMIGIAAYVSVVKRPELLKGGEISAEGNLTYL